jgi:cobalt/nickel transport protein
MRKLILIAVAFVAVPASTQAHYNMLIPKSASVERGKEVTLTYQWGHPFEHELFDAPKPDKLVVLTPDGKKTDLLDKLKKVTVKVGDKDVTTYDLAFTPEEVGDYVFILRTPPIWMAAEGEFYQDTVKVVVHVQAQKGWDQMEGKFELTPLTRPYGLYAGTVFQAHLGPLEAGSMAKPKPLDRRPIDNLMEGARAYFPVEIERYNPNRPKELPADEFITRVVKTDGSGNVTCDLPDPGWWCLTAWNEPRTLKRDGKERTLRERTTFWVHVAEKPRP